MTELVKPQIKLNDIQLEELYCSCCHKYLSVFPIKIYLNREIKCGRCNKDDDDGTVSLYQIIAKNYLFKCVNRYEGCQVLLRPREVFIHEQTCMGSTFICPKCEDGIKISVLDLIWHYKCYHPSSYLKENVFQCKLLDNDMLLYIQNDVVFFISYQYISSFKRLYISAVTLTKVDAVQTFTVIANSISKETEIKHCTTFDSTSKEYFEIDLSDVSIDLLKVFFVLKISKNIQNIKKRQNNCECVMCIAETDVQSITPIMITKETKLLTQDGKEISSRCFNCNNIMGPEIFICSQQLHFLCKFCKLWCGICNYKGFNENLIFFDSTKILRFICSDCKNMCSDMIDHKRYFCKAIKIFCWYCEQTFNKNMLESHINNHKGTFSKNLDLSDLLSFTEQHGKYFVLITPSNLVHIEWNKIKDNLFEITSKETLKGRIFLLTEIKAYQIKESPFKFNPNHSHKLHTNWYWLHKEYTNNNKN